MAVRLFKTVIIILSACGLIGSKVDSKSTERSATASNSGLDTENGYGKHFIFAYPKSRYQSSGEGYHILVTTQEKSATIRLSTQSTSLKKHLYTLTKQTPLKINISREVAWADRALELEADVKVSVYAFSATNQSAGYQVLSTMSLGHVYVTSSSAVAGDIGLIGVHNDTQVNIVLSRGMEVAYGEHVYKYGDTLTVTLDKLRVFRLRSYPGAMVLADKPIAVLASYGDCNPGCGHRQLIPARNWGDEYMFYSPITHKGALKITSAHNNTVVTMADDFTTTMKNAGSVLNMMVNARVPMMVKCVPRCMVHYDGGSVLVNVPMVSKFIASYTLYVPYAQLRIASVTVVVKCALSAVKNFVLNDMALNGNLAWMKSYDDVWCGTVITTLQAGINTLYHKHGTKFGIMTMHVGYTGVSDYHHNQSTEGKEGSTAEVLTQSREMDKNSTLIAKTYINQKRKETIFKTATMTLSGVCGLLLLLVLFVCVRTRRNVPEKLDGDDEAKYEEPLKQARDSGYQSVRRFPSFKKMPSRRETHSYETIKLPFKRPDTRPSLDEVFTQPGEDEKNQEYANVDLQPRSRESCPYMPMDEVLLESGLKGTAIALGIPSEDIYLTMKKLETVKQEDENISIL